MPSTDPTLNIGLAKSHPSDKPKTAREILEGMDSYLGDFDRQPSDVKIAASTGLPDRRMGQLPSAVYGDQAGRLTPSNKEEKYENNVQSYANSEMAQTELHEQSLKNTFFGQRPPNLQIKQEKPEHVLIMFLKAEGKSHKEIAEQLGMSQSWVSQVTRQPWFTIRLMEFLNERGKDSFDCALKSAVLPAIEKLAELSQSSIGDEDVPASVQFQASKEICNRFFGAPVVRTENTSHQSFDVDRIRELERQADALREERLKLNPTLPVEVGAKEQSSN